jgi:hypothetical protein
MNKVIKWLMGDMDNKLFWPVALFLFVLLIYGYTVWEMSYVELGVMAVVVGVVFGLIYATIVPPSAKEEAKAQNRLERIQRFFRG